MKIWAKTDGAVREGKYLVVRRDGTVPHWAHFVIGGEDPSAGAALRAYASDAERRGLDPEYVASIRELVRDFTRAAENAALQARIHKTKGADPDAGPHRTDCQPVIEMMRGNGDVAGLVARAEAAETALAGMREALEPFAAGCDTANDDAARCDSPVGSRRWFGVAMDQITVEDFLSARAALNPQTKEG